MLNSGMWPWYITGPLIGITVPLLLLVGGKSLGISSILRHTCAMIVPSRKIAFLNYPWKKEAWQFLFVAGIASGGALGFWIFGPSTAPLLPEAYFSVRGAFLLLAGGFLVGFGVRYAGGCTSGHTIFGLSQLRLSALIASVSFFAGGLAARFIIGGMIP